MDYPAMQDQPSPFGRVVTRRMVARRRTLAPAGLAVLLLLAAGGVAALLLWPQPPRLWPKTGTDAAVLAGLITLPAQPRAVRWTLTALPPVAPPSPHVDVNFADISEGRWRLQADLTLAAADVVGISGAEAFFKPPFTAGRLVRTDETHLRLVLETP